MKHDYITYNVGTHYLSALINGDVSGLTEEEILDVNAFEEKVKEDAPEGFSFRYFNFNEANNFGTCEVSGLLDDVSPVEAVYWEDEK